MNWRGKMIGGSIGSLLGPWGTLAGAAAGHLFVDRKGPAPEKQALRLLAVTAGALCELAGADGPFGVKEDQTARAILDELNRSLGAALRPHELAYLLDDAARIDRGLARLAAAVRDHPPLARQTLLWLWRAAACDGDPVPAETARIAAFAAAAALPEPLAAGTARLFTRDAAGPAGQARRDACGVLGVPYHADAEALKRAYRAQSLKYHPDKHAGLDPDIRALTAEKFAQVKAAYDLLAGAPARLADACVRLADCGRLAPAAAGGAVRCFLCDRPGRLPAQAPLDAARCPACQAFLAFERALAEQLAGG